MSLAVSSLARRDNIKVRPRQGKLHTPLLCFSPLMSSKAPAYMDKVSISGGVLSAETLTALRNSVSSVKQSHGKQ